MSTQRIVVQRSVAENFRKVLAETAEKIFGKDAPAPVLVASATVDKNKKMVADAMSKGANVIFGDPKATEANGYSMRPMIVDNVTKDMDIYSTESFGPTVSMIVVDSDDDAIALANDTEYGLTSAVFTGELFRGLRMAKEIQSG